MHEPSVTLTDFALAALCAALCAFAARWPVGDARLRRWWIVFFASIGLAALLGGLAHGFFPPPTPLNRAIWKATLLCIGVSASASWIIGAAIQFGDRGVVWATRLAAAQFVAYAAVVLGVNSSFIVAIAAYLPATVFLLVAMVLRYRNSPARDAALGIVGFVLTFVAAAVQTFPVAVHPVYFDHNALYHVIQGVALYLIYRGARWTVMQRARSDA